MAEDLNDDKKSGSDRERSGDNEEKKTMSRKGSLQAKKDAIKLAESGLGQDKDNSIFQVIADQASDDSEDRDRKGEELAQALAIIENRTIVNRQFKANSAQKGRLIVTKEQLEQDELDAYERAFAKKLQLQHNQELMCKTQVKSA